MPKETQKTRKIPKDLQNCRRIVIKVGTQLLSDPKARDGIDHLMLEKLAQEIAFLRKEGIQVMLVSSGAVYAGIKMLSRYELSHYELSQGKEPALRQRQALSALGQSALMSAYQKVMAKMNIPAAQLLLSAGDFQNRRTYLNMAHTITELLRLKALPIVNENDTIATEELQFGENDLLSAASAAVFHADYLLILTAVEGFMLGGERISYIEEILPEHWQAAQGPQAFGQGGMRSKLRAAHLCSLSAINCAILPGTVPNPVQSFLNGADLGTFFAVRQGPKLSARKRWLLLSPARGTVIIDRGAREALEKHGSSLLPVGLRKIQGHFLNNEVIEIKDENEKLVGRGLTNYSYKEVLLMLRQGAQDPQRQKAPGRQAELIHRDNLVLVPLPHKRGQKDPSYPG